MAARNRIAVELDDTKWNNHKSYCRCDCGLTNPQAVVALVKELRATEAELATLPAAPEEASDLDRLADELASRRATRRTATSGL